MIKNTSEEIRKTIDCRLVASDSTRVEANSISNSLVIHEAIISYGNQTKNMTVEYFELHDFDSFSDSKGGQNMTFEKTTPVVHGP